MSRLLRTILLVVSAASAAAGCQSRSTTIAASPENCAMVGSTCDLNKPDRPPENP